MNARRGRRDNGLDATLWAPVRDVDPRIGEHLLDVLQAAGIAAYLEPASDVGPYTRTVTLPSPPSDRLFVDRTLRTRARELVEELIAQHPEELTRGPVAERAGVRTDLDEDAEWKRIVDAFEAEHGRSSVQEQPSAAPPPPPHEPDVLDRPDEHYEPPPAPPVPLPGPGTLYAALLVGLGVLLVGAPGALRLSPDVGLVLGLVAIAGGVALAVSRMRDRSDDGDDGAVV